MIYTVIANGHSYDLPSKTIGIMEKLEEAMQIDNKPLSIRQKYQKLFEFAKVIMGENASEILGGEKVADIDVGELELLILKIRDAYNAPIEEFQNEKLEESLEKIPADKIKAITDAAIAISEAEKNKK